jgi:hypothetical protein
VNRPDSYWLIRSALRRSVALSCASLKESFGAYHAKPAK